MAQLSLICGARREYNPAGTLAMLMSGGVDSSTGALKLRAQGWDVIGVNMKIPLACGGAAETRAVEEVCAQAGIDLYRLDAAELFMQRVIGPFREEYRRGRTPNPCCDCNRELKFGALWDLIEAELGVLHLATGHYARVLHEGGRHRILRAANTAKDQSYFIYGVPPQRLPYLHLPLGELSKDDTRALAQEYGLAVAQKPESMELCFAGGGDYRSALPEGQVQQPGDFISATGKILGRHTGIQNYTIGQRKLGMSFAPEPYYVLRILPQENAVMVGPRAQAYTRRVSAQLLAVHQPELLVAGAQLWAKIRSGGEPRPCRIEELSGNLLRVEFAAELFAPTPGQHLVLYDSEGAVIAGGTMEASANLM